MIVIAALLVIGGLVSWYGLRDGATQAAE